MTTTSTLLIPIEYYECLAGQRDFTATNFNIRVFNEARQQAWEQEQARNEIRNLKWNIK